MIVYNVDPFLWHTVAGQNPKKVQFHDVIWEPGLTHWFLNKLGQDGWILAIAVPFAVFYKEVKDDDDIKEPTETA